MAKKIQSPEHLQSLIDAYFTVADAEGKPYTVPGLAYFLGYSSRQSIYDLTLDPILKPIISRAKLRIEEQRVVGGLTGANNAYFSTFILKNSHKYHDKSETELSGPGGGPMEGKWTIEVVKAKKTKK